MKSMKIHLINHIANNNRIIIRNIHHFNKTSSDSIIQMRLNQFNNISIYYNSIIRCKSFHSTKYYNTANSTNSTTSATINNEEKLNTNATTIEPKTASNDDNKIDESSSTTPDNSSNTKQEAAPTIFVGPGGVDPKKSRPNFIRRIFKADEQLPIDPGAIHAEALKEAQQYILTYHPNDPNSFRHNNPWLQGTIPTRGLDRCPSPYAPGIDKKANVAPPSQPIYPEPDSTTDNPIYTYPRKLPLIYQEYIGDEYRKPYSPPELSTPAKRFYNVFTHIIAWTGGLYCLLEWNESQREQENVQDSVTVIRKRYKAIKNGIKESFNEMFASNN